MKSKKRNRKPAAAPAKARKAKTPDDYLAALSANKGAALEALRGAIKTAAPKAEECINYGVPALRLNGKFLLAYGAAKNHCAFYPGSAVQTLASEILKLTPIPYLGSIRMRPAPHLIEEGLCP